MAVRGLRRIPPNCAELRASHVLLSTIGTSILFCVSRTPKRTWPDAAVYLAPAFAVPSAVAYFTEHGQSQLPERVTRIATTPALSFTA